MRKGRTAVIGGVLGSLGSVFVGPRAGESRRAALVRLQSWVRRRGGVDAFAGTPCSREGAADKPPED